MIRPAKSRIMSTLTERIGEPSAVPEIARGAGMPLLLQVVTAVVRMRAEHNLPPIARIIVSELAWEAAAHGMSDLLRWQNRTPGKRSLLGIPVDVDPALAGDQWTFIHNTAGWTGE